MERKNAPARVFIAGMAALAIPSLASASDFSGLYFFLYGVILVVFAIVLTCTWGITNLFSNEWMKWSTRVAVILFFWTPVPSGPRGEWLPFALALYSG
jgi:hypothetical protein